MKYKYIIGDEIIITTKSEHKSNFFSKIGRINLIFQLEDEFPYDIKFYDNNLNGYYSFAEGEMCLTSEYVESEVTEINLPWTPEQITKMYECLVGTYPLIKRFVDETHDLNILKTRDKELISDAQSWLLGFQSYKHD